LISAEARTVACMDIGTNSIRLLVVRIHPDYSSTVLTQLKQMVRLGDGAFILEYLQPDAIDRAVYVARQFAQLARAHGAETIITAATAATREAANQGAFVQPLQQKPSSGNANCSNIRPYCIILERF
jgi:exopolyphosphatase / guanosine-5'-triphosphate,3'-diphosphate pyrophosphatase